MSDALPHDDAQVPDGDEAELVRIYERLAERWVITEGISITSRGGALLLFAIKDAYALGRRRG